MPESESGHCVRVLRHSAGDILDIVDGKGHAFTARLTDPHPRHAMVELLERREVPLYWEGRLVLAVAPTKIMDRMEWLVEKATEIGFDRFIPLLCRYSERKEIKTERLEKTALSAMKQSLKATLPEISPMTPFARAVEQLSEFPNKYIAHCIDDGERRLLSREYRPGGDTAILIGPEGDFSPQEVKLALEAGFTPISLGQARLRTETAALTSLQTLHTIMQLSPSTT